MKPPGLPTALLLLLLLLSLCGNQLVVSVCEPTQSCETEVVVCIWEERKKKDMEWKRVHGEDKSWVCLLFPGSPLPLRSLVLLVMGVITCGPGQKVSPLCLIWKTATAPPTAGTVHLRSDTLPGIRERIKKGAAGPKLRGCCAVVDRHVSQDKGVKQSDGSALMLSEDVK